MNKEGGREGEKKNADDDIRQERGQLCPAFC